MTNNKNKDKIIYPELSYRIIKVAYNVYNQLGYGYQEKYFQRAIAFGFKEEGIEFEQEREIKLFYNNQFIGKYFLDFIIEEKIIVELKIVPPIKLNYIKQVIEYLKATNLKLAIIICFARDKVQFKRVINSGLKEY